MARLLDGEGVGRMWWQVLAAAIGIWLMAAPAILDFGESLSNVYHVLGPVAASFATMAAWDVLRAVRFVNLPIGLGVAAAPLVLGAELPAILAGLVSGPALIGLSLLARASRDRYAGGWRSLTR